MAFSQKQYESIRDSVARLNIWEGSVRSGKTVGSIWRWMDYLKRAPEGGTLLMIGKTHKTLQRNIIEPIQAMAGKHRCRHNRGTSEFHIFGRKCDLVGANDERAQDMIRGSTVAGAYGDEIALYPESFFKMLLSRMSVKGAKFFGTTNPDSPYHWLKTEYLDRESELDLKRFSFKLEDNINLDPAYVAALKLEYTGLWYQRFIEGLWVLAEGIVYDMWREARHMVDIAEILRGLKQDRFKRHFMAVDYGTHNPFAAGLFGHNGKLPCYLEKEYYFNGKKAVRQKTDADYADDLTAWLGGIKPSHVYVDPSALSFITEFKRRGYNVVPAENSVLDGIRFVSQCLSTDNFYVARGCENVKKEAASYVWDDKAQKRGEDKPLKEHDHCMDMIRYGLFSHFFKMFPQRLLGLNYR